VGNQTKQDRKNDSLFFYLLDWPAFCVRSLWREFFVFDLIIASFLCFILGGSVMAMGRFFNCNKCGKSISSWSDGNPYYFDEQGIKRNIYHPDHENLARCVGNDSPHLCLGSGASLPMDSIVKRNKCPECKSSKVKSQFTLEGCVCAYCKEGEFVVDPDKFAIS